MSKNGCKDCTNRHLGCHSTCEIYAEYKAGRDKFNEDKLKNSKLQTDFYGVRKARFDSL